MSDNALILVCLLGIPVLAITGMLGLWLFQVVINAVERGFSSCQDVLEASQMRARQTTNMKADDQSFRQWLESKMGVNTLTGDVDQRLIAAQEQAEFLRVLIEEEIPKAALQCLNTHRLMAKVIGAFHYSEVAYEPDCHRLRRTMTWLLGHTSEMLDLYPLRFDDKRLLHNSIVLRKRALPTCRRCPYIQLPIDGAPLLCPTAELVQIQGVRNAQ